MLEEDILVKNEKLYSASELGLKLISLVHHFENLDSTLEFESEEYDYNEPDESTQKLEMEADELPLIKRPEGLSALVSVFEYFEGKNYDFMERNFSLDFPEPISTNQKPRKWIQEFSKQHAALMKGEKSKDWLVDRYLKLGYGTRGLHDYGLMDASVSVPPLDSFFLIITELLTTRGKAGLYAKTGMGKSRIALYIASYWIRKFKTISLYIQNPHLLNEKDYNNLLQILSSNVASDRKSPKWLIIIEDAHLCNENQIDCVKKLIAGASNKSYSIFVSFTDIQVLKEAYKSENSNINQMIKLKEELIPNEFSDVLDLNDHWKKLRPFFKEWIKWVAVDILFDVLPSPEVSRVNTSIYGSPWSFVVSLGFLKTALKNLQKSISTNTFPLILYYSLAQIYVMRGEREISLNNINQIFEKYFNQELQEMFGGEWNKNLIEILNSWTLPLSRLLPPYKYIQNKKTLSKEGLISFYHLEWANEVCNYLESTKDEIEINFDELFMRLFPILHKIWIYLNQSNLISSSVFSSWLRNCVRFDVSKIGEVILTTLMLEPEQKKKLLSFNVPDDNLKLLEKTQLVNWMFIKSVINN